MDVGLLQGLVTFFSEQQSWMLVITALFFIVIDRTREDERHQLKYSSSPACAVFFLGAVYHFFALRNGTTPTNLNNFMCGVNASVMVFGNVTSLML